MSFAEVIAMQIKDAAKKWNISERRIRKLISDGRIEGAKKIGNTWNIPDDTDKPIDKRVKDEIQFIINLHNDYFISVDKKLDKLNIKRPLFKEAIESLKNAIYLEWTYNSNGIEGNTLTLKETKVVLEGITIGGKSVKEHLEAINHKNAIEYLEELVNKKTEISEWNIKVLHQLVLKGIDDDNAGKYRNHDVIISGAQHRPPSYIKVPELMEKLIINYNQWNKYHPIIRATLFHGELVKIHPFIDGNGRTSRLIMNLILMRSGYVPVVIKKSKRLQYYEALDKAHTTNDYTDFVKLVSEAENESLNKYLSILK